ncbi:MAG: helix-turn-helix domain-containing protein [Planctomycetes bacterium]|nr:helix-turn-helix domain-containing protein [Planctomycetota bacterium]
MMTAIERPSALDGAKALTHGLAILRILVQASGPLTSTEIAARMGLHQSSASRILKALAAGGYVKKPDYHSFAPDYGVLALGGRALQQFPLTCKPRAAMIALAERANGLAVSLGTLWRGQMLYFLRVQRGHEPVPFFAGSFPLHLSSPGLRLLLEHPVAEARAELAASRKEHGWSRPTSEVPATANAVLTKARKLIQHDCLPLVDWQSNEHLSAAIPVVIPGHEPVALALSGPKAALPLETVLLLLLEGRRAVEQAMKEPD